MEKLLSLFSISQKIYGRWLFQRLLLSIIMVIGLVITIAFTVTIIIAAALYSAYVLLLGHGFSVALAMIFTFTLALLTVIMLAVLLIVYVNHLRTLPQKVIKRSQLGAGPMETIDAFIQGFVKG